jgi:hypothetical protein
LLRNLILDKCQIALYNGGMIGNESIRKQADRLIRQTLPEWVLVERDFKRTRDVQGRNHVTLAPVKFLEEAA